MNIIKEKKKIVFIYFLFFFFILCNNPSNYEPKLNITILAQKEVTVRDTLLLEIKIENGFYESDMQYCWQEENSDKIDTLTNQYYKRVWNFPDTGFKKIRGWIIKQGKRCSEIDSITVRITYFKPQIKISGSNVVIIYEKSTFKATSIDKDGTIDKYEWIIDSNIVKTTNSKEDSFYYIWGLGDTGIHTIKAVAIDNDGLKSDPDSLIIEVRKISPPILKVIGDTFVSPLDTVIIVATTHSSQKNIEEYLWSYDEKGIVWSSTNSNILKRRFLTTTSKRQVIRSKIVYKDGIISPSDSVSIFVNVNPPEVKINYIEKAYAKDTLKISATVINPDNYFLFYKWDIETTDGTIGIVTDSPSVNFIWSEADTGNKKITLTVIDKDSLFFIKSSLTLRISINAPLLIPIPDTVISYLDTLHIKRSFLDSTVKSLFYYWDAGADGWDDTTVIPEYKVVFNGKKSLPLVTKVIDQYKREYCDTVYIYFNLPPVIDSFCLKVEDTIWLNEKDSLKNLILNCKISDPDNDSLTAFILWGKEQIDTFYLDSKQKTIVLFDSLGIYRWSIVVKDMVGHITQQSGSLLIGREHTICFAGHSYCTGDGDTSGKGGFRLGVISALRDSIGKYEKVRAIGPFVSAGLMWKSPADDSCFAISGSTAREIQLLFENAYKTLSADIWVVMLGVNGGFDNKEKSSTFAIIKEIIRRNPSARLYFILSPPFSSSTNPYRRWFNQEIKDTLDSLYARGYYTFVVRGDSLLSQNKEDLRIDSTLSSDGLHPNTAGYMILRDGILKVMFGKEPFALPRRKKS
ncbi:MAG: SGNH/GDSL hydrolase family protein [Chitinispirillaceae bacterium]|nr:SGNH/GDSL hydrolase family protein [Chitinispirillaceae bacterium]